jgi:radical SAM superfamily enzyme YgiQ (UPF0313 family)
MVIDLPSDRGSGRVRISVKEQALTLSFDPAPIYTFDRSGRLVGAFLDGRNYKRGLDGRILEKRREAGDRDRGRRVRRILDPGEGEALMGRVRRAAAGAERILARRAPETPAAAAAQDWLGRIRSWDPPKYQAHREAFHRLYRPVGILPPDQYLSVVLQVTEGCPWNRCTFCAFYRDRSYRVRPLEEFEGHIRGVKAFLGEGIGIRRSIFLADANALAMARDPLLRRLDAVRSAFPTGGEGPSHVSTHSFLDTFTSTRKTESEFREMAQRGLKRVYIGLETGDDRLLEALNKPGGARQAVDVVRAARAGGVRVGVILMIGVGGRQYAESHVAASVDAVNAMGLGHEDFIYLSEMVVHPSSEYEGWAREAGIEPLRSAELEGQRRALASGFRFPDPSRPPKVATYDIREFLY